jgi:hypothetical protein
VSLSFCKVSRIKALCSAWLSRSGGTTHFCTLSGLSV